MYHLGSHKQVKRAPRRKRNLKTFNLRKAAVKSSKEKIIQADRDRLEQCLRSKIFYSKERGCPVETVEQYNELPRAIANADGSMYKTAKSTATTALSKLYPACFSGTLSQSWHPEVIIIDGMFIIQSAPLGTHKLFQDYANFLINRWLRPFFKQLLNQFIPIVKSQETGENSLTIDHINVYLLTSLVSTFWKMFPQLCFLKIRIFLLLVGLITYTVTSVCLSLLGGPSLSLTA